MALQLIYTSAREGLQPGAQGFTTVACTRGIKPPLAKALEALSAYERIYPLTDERAAQNPVCYAHTHLTAGSETWSVLSRIAPAGADYSGRSNSLAHHIALQSSEGGPGGPAHAVAQSGLFWPPLKIGT